MNKDFNSLVSSGDVLFMMLGAVMVFAMHGGFAFLEVGTVRKKNQVNALVKILVDFALSTLIYFFIGYGIAYGIYMFQPAEELLAKDQGYELVHFFFLLTFAAAIPAIISGGIAERAKFWTQAFAAGIFVGIAYPLFEGMVWGQITFLGQEGSWLANLTGGVPFHDYAGSVVVHSMGGWIALAAVIVLGPRFGRWDSEGRSRPIPISNVPFMALGSWMLCVGWFGFNVMSAATLQGISGLVAINSLFAMAGGIIAALVISKNDPGFIHNGALAGLVAICAGSDQVHPIGALAIGAIAGVIFVKGFTWEQEKLKIDDVLGVWPLHGLAGSWGGIACGIFGQKALGGLGDVSLLAQLIGTLLAIVVALVFGFAVYKILDKTVGIRLDKEDEQRGSDLAIHNIESYPEDVTSRFT
ncbi:MAG: ammonium transporter [Nitrospina sp.]|jgi:ammonium transporter, Amt family|nr:ammonium transporter [Nitrospina sp.]MBT3510509.1 ammonium transporter [Nitrospina sp.]MBT3875730.1 ammonium transporter [Nitrospina sp.]MBT4049177.1 ammonium transporter [Nitrospina sp.]MBT4557146.1 ammonium transporter [Nitrospina sp.]